MGKDHRKVKKDDERQQLLESNNTFAMIAEEYTSSQTHLLPATHKNNRCYVAYLNEIIGDTPMKQIKPIDVLDACRVIESKGYLETALKQSPVKHYPAITDPVECGQVLRSIDDYKGSFEMKCALKLMPMLFVRAVEMRYAKWSDFNLENKTWTFTPRKTKHKIGVLLIVPLPQQAVAILTELARHRRSEFVFPAIHTAVQPMSENTMN